MNQTIEIWVPGIPAPGGSKKGFYNPKLKRVMIVDDNSEKHHNWMANVSQAAAQVVKEMVPGPLKVRFDFVFTRPKSHYGTGKNSGVLKASAPPFPSVKPDCTKIVRSTEDALRGLLWEDDSQIVTQFTTKRYGPQAGCLIRARAEDAA